MQSVECEDSEDSEDNGVLSETCNVKGMKWGLGSMKRQV